MNKLKNFIESEIKGWKRWEVVWLAVACIIITVLSIYCGDNLMGVVSAITGVACVVCTGKGKLNAYIFGLINCILYAIIAYKAKLYGETMLNMLYYVPMQFYGFYVWHKNMNADTGEVIKKHMTDTGKVLTILGIAVGTYAYKFILDLLGDVLPMVDSFTTVASVVAMIVSIKMYSEQWWIWVCVNVVSIGMWLDVYLTDGESIATLLMWIVYLGNSIIMLVKWEREALLSEIQAKEALRSSNNCGLHYE